MSFTAEKNYNFGENTHLLMFFTCIHTHTLADVHSHGHRAVLTEGSGGLHGSHATEHADRVSKYEVSFI